MKRYVVTEKDERDEAGITRKGCISRRRCSTR